MIHGFRGFDFRGKSLNRRILSGFDLAGCNFDDCDLECARLNGCDLKDASFKGANLNGAILAGSYLVGAKLDCYIGLANLSGAYVSGDTPPDGWAKDADQRLYRRDRR